jgi:4-hydroxybutyrate CoA-transferase
MTIGIKYCGGCNPRYDHSSLAARLKEDLPDIQIAAAGDVQDYVVVLCGCSSACASHSHVTGKFGKCVVTDGKDYAALLQTLRALNAAYPQTTARYKV